MIPIGPRRFSRDIGVLYQELPGVKIEVRMDSAFFSDEIVTLLDGLGVEFTFRFRLSGLFS